MHIPQVCPRGRDIHFWVMENMQEKYPFNTVKWRFFAFLVVPENAYPTSLPQG